MLRWRLIIGSLLIAGMAALAYGEMYVRPIGTLALPVALAVAWLATGEMLSLFAARNLYPLPWVPYLANVLIVGANWLPHLGLQVGDHGALTWPMIALAGGVIMAFIFEMMRFSGPGGITERLALAILPQAYIGVLLTFIVQLRLLGPTVGIAALCTLLLVVKLGDIGAYTAGRLTGRHKMVPLLSPGKTWEGFVGGLAAACLGAWLGLEVLLPTIVDEKETLRPGWHWLVFGLLVGTTGVVGDLAESLLKRDAGVKDSSRWLPGFGGILDVLDSILLAAPVAYLGFIWHV